MHPTLEDFRSWLLCFTKQGPSVGSLPLEPLVARSPDHRRWRTPKCFVACGQRVGRQKFRNRPLAQPQDEEEGEPTEEDLAAGGALSPAR